MSTKPQQYSNNCEDEEKDIYKFESIEEEIEVITTGSSDFEGLAKKANGSSFAKNFDECMRRLHEIEKEHDLIEENGSDIQLFYLSEKIETREMTPTEAEEESQKNYGTSLDSSVNQSGKESRETKECLRIKLEVEQPSKEGGCEMKDVALIRSEKPETGEPDKATAESLLTENQGFNPEDNQESISKWYSNLRQHFEKKENENDRNKEVTCRIMGATLKTAKGTTKKGDEDREKKHYFSRLVKPNKSLVDEELPDPDKVKNIRAMFQESANTSLDKKMDHHHQFGGSLQNISERSQMEQPVKRPLSAQCNRHDFLGELRANEILNGKKGCELESSDASRGAEKRNQVEMAKKKLMEKFEKDMKAGKESFHTKKYLQPKWTDTGSVSSGVSSDLSSFDTDLDSYSKEGMDGEPEDDYKRISDDDILDDENDKHYVQDEMLEKIRFFGTSVTYFGGEMITCSVGPLLSPTTQAILEEINEKYEKEPNASRSFDEFYRKYVEVNEPNKKKKISRTRSFGHSDLFQKPNVLNNKEIELYKNDLELEIGIRKPHGPPKNNLVRRNSKEKEEAVEEKSAELPKPEIVTQEIEDKTEIDRVEEPEKLEEPESIPQVDTTIPIHEGDTPKTEVVDAPPKKEHLPYHRSQSTPTFLNEEQEKEREDVLKAGSHEYPSRDILFGYEKTLFNTKRKPDMEFEEFEVCETTAEKLEKIKERIRATKDDNNNSTTQYNKNYNSRWPIETSVMADIQRTDEQTPKVISKGKTVAKTKVRLF